MEVRKLIKFGNSSHVLALPHKWLKEHKLNKGDLVYISRNGGDELVIAPEIKEIKKELKVKNLNIDGKDLERVKREIVAAYLNDFNIIKIGGKKVEKNVPEFRNIIHNLIALEILEQNEGLIVTRDFLNLETISIKKLINKIDMISRSMFSEISPNLNKEKSDILIDRDKDLNRVYFLAKRTIKSFLNDPELIKKLNYTYKDLFYYWNVLYHIESTANKLKGLSWFFSNWKPKCKEIKKQIFEVYKKIEKHYLDAMKSFYLGDVELAYKISCVKNILQDECDKILKKKNLDKTSIRILDKLKAIIIKVHNIPRDVYDRYS